MSRIRSKWTGPERALHNHLKGNKVRHGMHPPMFGRPDALVGGAAVFVDGCLWHRCPDHYREPKTNRLLWRRKIARNVERDAEVTARLTADGVRVVRIWECELRSLLRNGGLLEKIGARK